MQFIEGEELISTSSNKQVVLTSHRIRYETSSWGHAYIVSFMLEKVSSVEVRYHSWIFVLILGILSILAGTYIAGAGGREAEISPIFFGAGVVLILTFLFTRQHVITITSDGGTKINFSTRGMKREVILDFIEKLETAKSKRIAK